MSLTEEDKQWVREQLERVETSILSAFHQWGSPSEAGQRSHSALIRALDLEVESLKDRVEKLEHGPA